jgi:hypothetical protein
VPLDSNFSGSLNAAAIEKLMTTSPRIDVIAADGVDQPVRPLHAEGKRRHPAGRLTNRIIR